MLVEEDPRALILGRVEVSAEMGGVVGLLQCLDAHPRVDLGDCQAPVVELLLDVADVGATLEHQGGGGVKAQHCPRYS